MKLRTFSRDKLICVAIPPPRFRGQSLTVDSVADSRLAFGGSLGRADWRYGRGMGSDRAAFAA